MMKTFVLLFLFIVAFSTKAFTYSENPDSIDSCHVKYFQMLDNIIQFGKKYIGTPYRYGGKNEKGFDCSGFVHFIFEPWGFNLPYSSRGYAMVGEEIKVENARKGDFALFKGRNASATTIGHVALVIDVDENGSVYILHATVNKGVTIDNMTTEPYYTKRYVTMRRLVPDCDKISSEPQIILPSGASN